MPLPSTGVSALIAELGNYGIVDVALLTVAIYLPQSREGVVRECRSDSFHYAAKRKLPELQSPDHEPMKLRSHQRLPTQPVSDAFLVQMRIYAPSPFLYARGVLYHIVN
jgi:hypothetical protein